MEPGAKAPGFFKLFAAAVFRKREAGHPFPKNLGVWPDRAPLLQSGGHIEGYVTRLLLLMWQKSYRADFS